MSFNLFDYQIEIEEIVSKATPSLDKMTELAAILGEAAFPEYLRKYIRQFSPKESGSILVHPSTDISGYSDADKANVARKKGFMGETQIKSDKHPNVLHHLKIFHNGGRGARLFYKFIGKIQFIKNTSHDC